MSTRDKTTPRLVRPRMMAAASTTLAAGLLAASPASGAFTGKLGDNAVQFIKLPAQLMLVASEGGEGGEAGVANTDTDDVAYLTGIGLIEGEVRAAVAMFDAGEKEIAEAYMYRPGEDILDQLKPGLEARGSAGLEQELADLRSAVSESKDGKALHKVFDAFETAANAARNKAQGGDKARLAAITRLVRSAAQEYGEAYGDAGVENEAEYHHSWGFVQVARRMAEALKASGNAAVSQAAAKALEQIIGIETAWPAMTAPDKRPVDPSVLHGAAARIEIAALKVK